jgi:hypothetical protein
MGAYCNIHGGEVDNFIAYNKRPNAKCPVCKSVERHRLVALYFGKQLESRDGAFQNIVHILPELPLLTKLINNGENCHIDDLDSGGFDCIFASHILHYIENDIDYLKTIYAALLDKGKFITLIPQTFTLGTTYEDATITTEAARDKHYGNKSAFRRYGLDFTQRCKNIGFYVRVHYVEGNEVNADKMYYDEQYMIATKKDCHTYGLRKDDILYEFVKGY